VTGMGDPLRTTLAVCVVGAVLAVAVGVAMDQWRAGLLLGLGLLAGSSNGYLVRGALRSELDFRLTSGVRLLAMTALAVGVAALVDVRLIPFAAAGLALSQLILAVAAGVRMLRT
jgi:hypothetical protein